MVNKKRLRMAGHALTEHVNKLQKKEVEIMNIDEFIRDMNLLVREVVLATWDVAEGDE